MPELPTIVCASDLSEASQTAFRFAAALARDYGAKVVVLYVYPPPFNEAEAVDRARDPHFEASLIETLRSHTPAHPGTVVEFRVVPGTPAAEIVRVARESQCNMLVIGTHGRSGLRRALLGSVAEEVLRNAPCPVLTVRAGIPPPPTTSTSAATTNNGNELGGGD